MRRFPPGISFVSAADMTSSVRRSVLVAVRARATVHGGRALTMLEPFLRYLTVFKSRLGLANLVLDVTSSGHQPGARLNPTRRQVLQRRVPIRSKIPASAYILEYLRDKRLVTSRRRGSGRYRGWTLQEIDGAWVAEGGLTGGDNSLAFTRLISGWPTRDVSLDRRCADPANAGELIELTRQLRLLDKTKNAWTNSAQVLHGLRALDAPADPGQAENPVLRFLPSGADSSAR